MQRPTTFAVRAIALCVLVLMTSVLDAQAQSPLFVFPAAHEGVTPKGLRLPPLVNPIAASSYPQPASSPRCRRGRRGLIGMLIGAVGAAPLARLVHRRFENEAGDGTAAAATTVALGAVVGAVIGLASCG